MARLRPLSRARIAAAALTLGAAVAGAVALHVVEHGSAICDVRGPVPAQFGSCLQVPRAGWVDPVALGILGVGVLASAAVLLTAGRRFPRPSGPVGAALVLGVALLGAAILYVVGDPGGHVDCRTNFIGVDQGHECLGAVRVLGPAWVDPAVLGIVLLGAFGARGVLLTARRRHS